MTNSKGQTIWCDVPACEAEAWETVPASIDSVGDCERNYCYSCAEAYHVGAQHARMEERTIFSEAVNAALQQLRDLSGGYAHGELHEPLQDTIERLEKLI